MADKLALAALRPRRVALIKPSALGDVVHSTPVLAALRAHWPDAHIAWVVSSSLAPLVDGLPGLDEVIRFDRKALDAVPRGWLDFARWLASLRDRHFDLAIDLQGLLRSGLMTAATGAPVRVGLSDAREGATAFYTHRIPMPTTDTHAIDRLGRVVAALGAPFDPSRFLTSITDPDRAWARARLAHLARPRLVVNVGARWLTKRWPPESFADVAARAARELDASLITVGAPEDRPLVDAFLRRLGDIPALDLCAATTLPQLAAVAQACDLFLSNDTGPLHLAVAAGSPTVAVFTCTSPAKTGPYSDHADVVVTGVPCAASCIKSCPHLSCMTELAPDRVWAAVRRQLEAARSRRHHPAA